MQYPPYRNHNSGQNNYAHQPASDKNIYSSHQRPNPNMYGSAYHMNTQQNVKFPGARGPIRRPEFATASSKLVNVSGQNDSNHRINTTYKQGSFQKKNTPAMNTSLSKAFYRRKGASWVLRVRLIYREREQTYFQVQPSPEDNQQDAL